MAKNLSISLNAAPQDDENIQEVIQMQVEGVDIISVTVEAGASDMEVTLQPSLLTDVKMVAIKADSYPLNVGVPKLSYKVHETIATPIPLGNMQLFAGADQVALLGANPDKLYFSNTHTEDINLTIMVGRDATP